MGTNINQIFITLGTGFLLGLFFAPLLSSEKYIIGAIFIALFILFYIRKSAKSLLLFVFIFSFISALFYFELDNKNRKSVFEFKEQQVYVFECRVIGDVEIKNNQMKFSCRTNLEKTKEIFLIYTKDIEKSFLHGDILRIKTHFERPEPFKTDTDALFEYDEYLKTKNIFWVAKDSNIEVVSLNENNFRRKLFVFRDTFINPFTMRLKGDSENLFLGILFGKNILSSILVDSFRIVGLTHIIALSGYNITIIASWVKSIFGRFGGRTGSIFSIFSIILFILMTGIPITAVRAGIMAIVSMIALRTGNIYESLRALFLATLIMNILNPRLIYFDFSFQLSVLATLGIILFTAKLVKKLPKSWPYFLREITATTIGAQIAVLPLILYQTKLLSVLSLPVNILVLPFVPVVMLSGLLGGLAGLVFEPLSFPFVFVGDLALKVIINMSLFVSDLEISKVILKDFSLGFMLFLYAIIVFWAYKSRVFSLTDRV